MSTPLKRRTDYCAPLKRNDYGQIIKVNEFTKRTKKKKGNFFLSAIKLLFKLSFLGAFAYYVVPYNYFHYIEPMFANRILNRHLEFKAEDYLNTTNRYLYNSTIGVQENFSSITSKNNIEGTHHILVGVPKYSSEMAPIVPLGSMEKLEKSLAKTVNSHPYFETAIYVYDFNSGKSVSINGEKSIPVASMIKIPILFELFRQIETNKDLNINNKIIFEEKYKTAGSGRLQYGSSGYTTTLDRMANLMITESDNSASNLLLDYIGGRDALNRSFRNWGLKSSQISDWLPDMAGENKMSAKDLATILYNLDNPLFLSTKSREYIKDYMGEVKTDTLLPQGLEEGSIIYHKTGDIGTFVGDAGVIYTKSGKKYVAVVVVHRAYNDHRAKEYIQNISKTIYNFIEYKNK